MKVGSGRAVSFPVRGFVLTRPVSLFVMVKGMALGGRFELRLANGGSPPVPLWVFAALPPPPLWGLGGDVFRDLIGGYSFSFLDG